MSKLSFGDTEALRAFFASSLTAGYRSCIAAQSYEPRGPGYDPSTDAKLARLVFDGVHHGKSDWARMKRVLDHLSDAHVEVLRIVVAGGEAAIAQRLPSAVAAGRKLARERARAKVVQDATSAQDGDATEDVARRVAEATKAFRFDPGAMTVLETLGAAHDAIEAGLVDVTEQATALVAEATDAFHTARGLATEWRHAASHREDQRRSDFRESLRAERDAKASARFSRKLQGAA